MPTITVYRHGGTAGVGNSNATPPVRTNVQGWSAHAIRRNLLFLYSVDETRLEGLQGAAFTLTVKTCPETPTEWGNARDRFFRELRREGVHLVHWVSEWQRRGVPHLHMAAYWPAGIPVPMGLVLGHWLRITAPWGSLASGQHASPIWDVLGWNQYTSKHAARGLRHYQRNPAGIPQGWRGVSTGRMWGKLGSWELQHPVRLELQPKAFHVYRRLVRGWRIANARRTKSVKGVTFADTRRICSARGMLRCPIPELSRVRGISEWLPGGLQFAMFGYLAARGFDLVSI